MPEWSAERVVDEPLARRLIGERFPALAGEPLRLLAEGWDNTVWVAGGRWAFRFPRRSMAVPGVEREIAVLPRLAPLLPRPIPAPQWIAGPSPDFPWPFFGAPLLAGRELADAGLDDDARARLARPLGAFLRRLHSPEVAAAVGAEALPADPMGRGDMPMRVARCREALDAASALGLWRAPAWVERLLRDAERLAPREATAVAHGDLHIRHVLVDAAPDPLAAVIDWGDLCRGDPAIDLPLFWCALPPGARADFEDAYGPLDEPARLRSRVLALFLCAVLAAYAHHEGMPALEAESVAGLRRAVED